MTDEIRLPVLPLREDVVFPGVAVALPVGRARSLAALEVALTLDRRVLALTQRVNLDVADSDNLYRVGTIARIVQMSRGEESDAIDVLLHGESRARVVALENDAAGEIWASVISIDEHKASIPETTERLFPKLRLHAQDLASQRGIRPEVIEAFLDFRTDPSDYADVLAFYLNIGTDAKQRLLEIDSVDERLRTLIATMQHQMLLIQTAGQGLEPTSRGRAKAEEPGWDVFISHASEDKESIARPLAEELRRRGLRVWYDEFMLSLGDSLRASIDRGLSNSRFGVVVLSHNFFSKEWPRRELDGLTSREVAGTRLILPLWHQLSYTEVMRYSPTLADRLAISTDQGLDIIADAIETVVHRR